jgi:hypothetical protein
MPNPALDTAGSRGLIAARPGGVTPAEESHRLLELGVVRDPGHAGHLDRVLELVAEQFDPPVGRGIA